ncbi:transferase [Secundilactobacillus paracollinoides]|uniref:Transferase n=1 Tax=Secundilactobacillus paracollinoides TaxID=240427 RepID=A0A1B2IV83_9LACO|nr:sugar O-acetyltransferase [Secundilactobacillus paracollinoides]ANZ60163.1 transferase [Secundilactobacillus paracollinoides]ANZ62884.1 transferase [Secundilactobacillus paracollinoides]ANZ65957.1 transferase [Secundilactobacillus paracollinoides]KRL78429.1 hypothetical protein FC17_GL001017 [Secundilactobacillus paracollinoides DSM 15502 = JCM 11969]
MTFKNLMTGNPSYVSRYQDAPNDQRQRADHLCWQLNQMDPSVGEARQKILMQLFETTENLPIVAANFHCDYGFNVHFKGMTLLNSNVTILDSSPVTIGSNAFIAPGVVIACSGHAILPEQRAAGIGTSAPITLGDNVWIGANSVVTAGVTIGTGSIIGAGSVVTHDIPAGVIAVGSPAKPVREINEADRVELTPF